MIRYVFFDFGGCLDSGGIHTRTLFLDAFLRRQLIQPVEVKEFQEAYSRADEKMMKTGLAKSLELREFNRLNGALIAADLKLPTQNIMVACDDITELMHEYLTKNTAVIASLAQNFPLGIISNFTGNLEQILREYSLRDFFHSVTESFYVGVSKPDARIFHAALAKQEFSPAECLYVGDNPKNDIFPAKALGLKCVLIHAPGKKIECGADGYIEDLLELPGLIQRI